MENYDKKADSRKGKNGRENGKFGKLSRKRIAEV